MYSLIIICIDVFSIIMKYINIKVSAFIAHSFYFFPVHNSINLQPSFPYGFHTAQVVSSAVHSRAQSPRICRASPDR